MAQHRLRVAIRRAPQFEDFVARDQAVAVDAHEAVRELDLQRLQRFLDQVLAARMVHDDVLLLGLQVAHVVDGDQSQGPADPCAQVRAGAGIGACPGLAATTGNEGPHPLQRGGQALGAHRLHQVIDRLGIEGGQGVRIVRRAEHHRGAGLAGRHVARGFESIDARHGDVQQDQVGSPFQAGMHRLAPIHGLSHDLHAGLGREQRAQPLARQRLVVGDQHPHRFSPHRAAPGGHGRGHGSPRPPPRPRQPAAKRAVIQLPRSRISSAQTACCIG